MKNKRLFITVLGTILLALLIVGGTYAFWVWESSRNTDTNVAFTTQGKNFSCSADGGGNITSNDILLQPTSCTDSEHAIVREIHTNVVNNTSDSIRLDLWLDINSIASELASSSNFKWAISTSNESCDITSFINYGNFNRKSAGDRTYLTGINHETSENNTYYLYIWLDEEETSAVTAGKSFNMSLGGECSDSNLPNKPYINNSGLIPVKLSDTGSAVTAISEDDPSWYDYYNKKWANAVLVSDTNRSSYQNLSLGEEVNIPTSEILAYYVWIPRYSYKVWQYSGNSAQGQEQEIDIKFVGKNVKDVATQNGEWFTPPGFTFGDTELSGLWMAKFGTSNLANNSNYSLGCTNETCTNANNIRIINGKFIQYGNTNNVSIYFYASRSMEQDGNSFGLEASRIDSHMAKDSEWATAVYLSHSKYGINGIVYNNYKIYALAGCGSLSLSYSTYSNNCINGYGSNTNYPQSTTKNVSGIFDMAGGTCEYVMGSKDGAISSSGFSSMPESKYYDNYVIVSTLGTAFTETRGWYGSNYGCNRCQWIIRGGSYNTYGGLFNTRADNGAVNSSNGSGCSYRLVLVEE